MHKRFKERLLKLADAIENGLTYKKQKVRFGMDDWGAYPNFEYGDHENNHTRIEIEECGSACCIGGHADVMFTAKNKDTGKITDKGSERLGLTDRQKQDLFFPHVNYLRAGGHTNHWGEPTNTISLDNRKFFTKKRAAETIRNFVATGKINWRSEVSA